MLETGVVPEFKCFIDSMTVLADLSGYFLLFVTFGTTFHNHEVVYDSQSLPNFGYGHTQAWYTRWHMLTYKCIITVTVQALKRRQRDVWAKVTKEKR